jgi:hypothetical protein
LLTADSGLPSFHIVWGDSSFLSLVSLSLCLSLFSHIYVMTIMSGYTLFIQLLWKTLTYLDSYSVEFCLGECFFKTGLM